ncbi:DUF3541 domain-containing protein [Vibrio renipiscarius]|uniref:DUF3541 domain-containing protein n=1 Tax=Vibrio renipiscarius TaxID=1461322 RepID=A0A0C2K796_9VIBR|nr:DUF3541 domain-containing protein [Vibrio renipiscarius]KII76571.1 hypothetical protein OJ16_17460 [Vibrio renipiscarius]KII77908.1 hypothetical protein PL18_13110 [Vibrio renipiscarius]
MRHHFLALILGLTLSHSVCADNQTKQHVEQYKQSADLIRQTYEQQLYTLPAFKEGHYGLRMYRQTLDDKYSAAIWSDLARVTSRLNYFAAEVNTPEQIYLYSEQRLEGYKDDEDERSMRRFTVTKHTPEYLYLGVDLLGSMARANEYGLQHQQDDKLRKVIRRYDFNHYATDPEMIRAWAAQLANQVYWLRQLGEQDVVPEFIEAFQKTYPDNKDSKLSPQQYGNKLYGMTHIIFADSEYYQKQVSEQQHQWIFDYFRANIDEIIVRAKEDVIAEVGISFLLAGLENDPVVAKTRAAIAAAVNTQKGMVPSVTGDFDFSQGEHRNTLAIMLLDWQQVNQAPTYTRQPHIFSRLPYGLEPKPSEDQQ